MSHDQLQAAGYQFIHNTFHHLGVLVFAVLNEVKPYPGETQEHLMIRTMQLKSIGLKSGALDLFAVIGGTSYGFDAKTGSDILKPKQHAFIAKLRQNGGDGWEFRTLEQLKDIVTPLIVKHYGKDYRDAGQVLP